MTDLERLRAFAQFILESWPDFALPDEADIQDKAEELGLLEGFTVKEPCRENCWCADYYSRDDMAEGVTCYRRTKLVMG